MPSLRGKIKFLKGKHKLSDTHANRILQALDFVDYVRDAEYLLQWEDDDDFTRGFNRCLENLKRRITNEETI